MTITRRRVLASAAAASASLWLASCKRATGPTAQHADRGLRIDLRHVVQDGEERFELLELKREPAPPSGGLDTPDWGDYALTLTDTATDAPLVRVALDSNVDPDAGPAVSTLCVRCALPAAAFTITVEKRRPGGVLQPLYTRGADASLVHDAEPPRVLVDTLVRNGDARDHVDIAIVGDGYAAGERAKFAADAKRAAGYLFSVEPYKSRIRDFNVHAIFAESAESGVSDAYNGTRAASAFGTAYGSGAHERTLSVGDERKLRDAAAAVPYDALLVLANSRRYGGSAHFSGPAVVAIDSAAARYLVLHESAHAIAGLAEEYYIPSADGPVYRGNVEPWQPNVTTSLETTKWAAPQRAPSRWNKARYERYFGGYVKRYEALRAGGADEYKIEKLMREVAPRQAVLLGRSREVGFFEGANGYAQGFYRPEADCIMFSLQTDYYCAACTAAISRAIDSRLPKR
jgi:hypothetical protein